MLLSYYEEVMTLIFARDEDVTVTMYPNMAATRAIGSGSSGSTPGKVNRICGSFIAHILETLLSTNVQNVITAYCSKLPPDHESALALIATMKG